MKRDVVLKLMICNDIYFYNKRISFRKAAVLPWWFRFFTVRVTINVIEGGTFKTPSDRGFLWSFSAIVENKVPIGHN